MRDDGGWHLDKRVNVSHLSATICLVAGLFAWGSTIETRVALVEQNQTNTADRVSEDLAEIKETLKEFRDEFRELRRER